MSNEIDVAFVQQYNTNVALLLQQMGSKLRDRVMVGNYVGKSGKAVEQIGKVAAQLKTSRHADTPLIETPHDARWVNPADYEWADLIDDQDKIRMLVDIQSPYARNGAMALGRACDQVIIDAFFGTAKTGADGTTNTTLAGDNATTIAGNSEGLTVAKLRQAKEIMMSEQVDLENDTLYCVLASDQHEDLLEETQVISMDYGNQPVLAEGKIDRFMGFEFIHSELLPSAGGSSERQVMCYAKSGMHLGIWNDITTSIDRRPDKSNATQVYVSGTFGATRLEGEKFVEIECAE